MNKGADHKILYYPMDEVLENTSFFWVGRGGHGIIHPGNEMTRKIIASKEAEYRRLARSKRGCVVQSLLEKELKDTKFVAPRDHVLWQLEADENESGSSTSSRGSEIHCCRLSNRKKQSLLQLHHSMEQIASYPADVCIEVGDKWKREIISHRIREAGGSKRKRPEMTNKRPSRKEKRNAQNKKARLQGEEESSKGLERVLDPALQLATQVDSHTFSSFAALFPEEGEQSSKGFERVLDLALPFFDSDLDLLFAALFPEETGFDINP